MATVEKCLTPACKRTGGCHLEGLCPQCYGTAKRLIAKGATSWEELRALGMVKKKEDTDPFLDALKDKTDAEDRQTPSAEDDSQAIGGDK